MVFSGHRLVYLVKKRVKVGMHHVWCHVNGVSGPIGDGVHVECSCYC